MNARADAKVGVSTLTNEQTDELTDGNLHAKVASRRCDKIEIHSYIMGERFI